jgi:hypothetical protein
VLAAGAVTPGRSAASNDRQQSGTP